jgi:hypothetical protein
MDSDLRGDFSRRRAFQDLVSQVTSETGSLAFREVVGGLGLTASSAKRLQDLRLGQNKHHVRFDRYGARTSAKFWRRVFLPKLRTQGAAWVRLEPNPGTATHCARLRP